MTIVFDWSDEAMDLLGPPEKLICAVSGKPANPPFLYWMSEKIMIINADAFVEGYTGIGLLLDMTQLLQIAEHMKRGVSVGSLRDQAIRRIRGDSI